MSERWNRRRVTRAGSSLAGAIVTGHPTPVAARRARLSVADADALLKQRWQAQADAGWPPVLPTLQLAPARIEQILPRQSELQYVQATSVNTIRTRDDVIARSADPSEIARLLRIWDWQANTIRTFGQPDAVVNVPQSRHFLELSVQEFAADAGAAQAMAYWVTERSAATELIENPTVPRFGSGVRLLSGPAVSFGCAAPYSEATAFLRLGRFLARVSFMTGPPLAETTALIAATIIASPFK